MIDAPTLTLAGRQHGVIARRQLERDLGWSASRLHRTCRAGLLVPVTPLVVRVASSPETFLARCMAACLHLRGRGFLSGWTAGRLYGIRRMPEVPIHVTVAASPPQGLPDWVRPARSAWFSAADWVERDGMAVATPLRMLFGIAADMTQFRFERAAEDAWHLGLVTPTTAAEYLTLHRCRGKDGVAAMERWLDQTSHQQRPAQSDLERDLLDCLWRVGLPTPVRQHPVVLLSGELVHLDIAWPDRRFAVEPGAAWWHGGNLRQRSDQARDRACGEVGWHVIRFDETLRDDSMAAARQVRRIYLTRSPA